MYANRWNSSFIGDFVVAAIIVSLLSIVSYVYQMPYDTVGTLFFLNCVISVLMACVFGGKKVSLFKIYFIFNFIFMSFVPWIQYSAGVIFWGGGGINEHAYLNGAIVVFVSGIILIVVYGYLNVTVPYKNNMKIIIENEASNINLLILSTLAFCVLIATLGFDISGLFVRGTLDKDISLGEGVSAFSLLFSLTSRLIVFFSFVFINLGNNSNIYHKIFSAVLLLICVFPPAVPRFLSGFVYIPVLLMFFPRLRDGVNFFFVMIGAILFIFPFLNEFRSFSTFSELKIIPASDYFLQEHFDAFQNMIRVFSVDFITYGRQLLAVAFFFVPRIIWETKPVGTGQELANLMGYDFDNIAMPFLGEGYANFGYFGIFSFIVILAYIIFRVDRVVICCDLSYNYRIYSAVHYFYCGVLFFVLRGDLLSSVAYLCAGYSSLLLVRYIYNSRLGR